MVRSKEQDPRADKFGRALRAAVVIIGLVAGAEFLADS